MAKVIVHHHVKDYDTWKTHFDSGADARKAKGMTHVHAGRNSKDPNHVYVVFDVAEHSHIHDHLAHGDTKDLQEKGGVIGETNVVVLDY